MFSRIGQFFRKIFAAVFHRDGGKGEIPSSLHPGSERETLPSAESTGEDVLQSVVERLMEDEALTADLVDAAARQLLDWGIAQTERILRETGPASEESRARLAELRGQMREIARRVGQLPPEEQPDALQAALENR